MNASRPSCQARRALLAFVALLVAAGVFLQARQAQEEYKPEVGQLGKDVVWVPTSQKLVDRMLDMAAVTPADYVIDLGSGDGRLVITAAKRGARALGIEYNPDLVELSKRTAAAEGVTGKASFAKADIFESDFSQATVITMFLLPDLNLRLRPKLLDLKPGTRIVSNTFTMEDWVPDEVAEGVSGCDMWCTALLWIVPAKAGGTWKLPQGELTIRQAFQLISGTLTSGGSTTPIAGKLRGTQITFQVAGTARTEYTGRVSGNTMEGTVASGGGAAGRWSAARTGR